MKKYRIKIAVILFCLVLILITNFYLKSLRNEYVIDIKEVNAFYQISDGFIYFGRPTCPSCVLFKPLLTEVAKEENEKIYYFNTDYFSNNSKITEDELKEIYDKYQIQYVPALIKLVNGSLVGSFGASFIEEESGMIKEKIRDFIAYEELPVEIIPHYTIIITLFTISILIILMILLSDSIKSKNNIIFALSMTNVSIIIILTLSIQPIMDYLVTNNLSADPKMVILFFITIVISFISLTNLIINYNKLRKREGQEKDESGDTINDI